MLGRSILYEGDFGSIGLILILFPFSASLGAAMRRFVPFVEWKMQQLQKKKNTTGFHEHSCFWLRASLQLF